VTDVSNNQGYGQPTPDTNLVRAELDAARDKIGEATHAVREEAMHFAEAAREKVADKAEQGKQTVTTAVSDFAEAIRKASQELTSRDQTMAARLVSQAAEGLESLSRAASEKRPEDMLNAVRDFGRANPTAFLAGTVLAGIALGRFARSSAHHADAPANQPPQTWAPMASETPVSIARESQFDDEVYAVAADPDESHRANAVGAEDLGIPGRDIDDDEGQTPRSGY